MFKPLFTLANVLLFISLTVHAQSQLDNTTSVVCVVGTNQDTHKIGLHIEKFKAVVVTCSNEDQNPVIPKYIKFTCSEGTSLITVDVNITDGTHVQTITKNIEVTERNSKYEIAVLNMLNYEILQSGRAHIKSIVFKNNSSNNVLLEEIDFNNSSFNYEVKLNQIFTIDLASETKKNYFINLKTNKDVNINLYKSNGEYDHSISRNFNAGENFLYFSEMDLADEKYIVVISDIYQNNKKSSNSKITVMY